ncbi:MAG: N-acetylmuramoyl-L-alanine amidase [Chloroflexota bacterium]
METSQQLPGSQKERPKRINMYRQLWVVFSTGTILATLFTAFTPLGILPLGMGDQLGQIFSAPDSAGLSAYPTPTARPRPRIGIVSGHYANDSGAVCQDGLTEAEVNLNIATHVKANLINEGFDVDLLEEKDTRLQGYRALALVSIHADSCNYINNEASGFKTAPSLASAQQAKAQRLTACLTSRYQRATNLTFHAGSITDDMTQYHAFEEIHSDTTAAIIEVGFLNLDRQILTQQPDLIAEGISNGVLCYIRNEDATSQ